MPTGATDDTGGGAGAPTNRSATPSTGGAAGADPMPQAGPMVQGGPMMQEADAGAGDDSGGGAAQDGVCVVAVRLDDCCAAVVAATTMEVASGTCLVPWSERRADPQLASDCLALSPINCATVQCAVPEVPSHAVAVAPGGGCEFVDACQSATDCVRASDLRQCCDCGQSVPRSLAEADPCLWIEGEPMPDGGCPPARGCATCGACPEPLPLSCSAARNETALGCR